MELFINKYEPKKLEDYKFNLKEIDLMKNLLKHNINSLSNILVVGLDTMNNWNIIKCYLKEYFQLKKLEFQEMFIKSMNSFIKQNYIHCF